MKAVYIGKNDEWMTTACNFSGIVTIVNIILYFYKVNKSIKYIPSAETSNLST